MTEDLLVAFERCSIAGEDFHHADHVRVAFLYLNRFAPLEAMGRFSEALKNFAAHNDKAQRYHETITWAFFLLIRERMTKSFLQNGHHPTWEDFASANPDLLDWKNNILKKYYSQEILASDLARTIFILPDRLAEH